MPKLLPPSRSWFDWIDDFEYLEWPDFWFILSGVPSGIGIAMVYMAFDSPDEWNPIVSLGVGVIWLVVGVVACRLAILRKQDKG